MAFIEHALADDPTNWWAPDQACIEAMVRAAGFRVTGRPGHEIYICEPDPREPGVNKHLRELELRAMLSQVPQSADREPELAHEHLRAQARGQTGEHS
jgi:tRNA (mo5U34)-methyltransferase